MFIKLQICALLVLHCSHGYYGQFLRSDVMNLGVYNSETKKYEEIDDSASKEVLGGDDHDLKPHRKNLLGRDDHDFRSHKKTILGGDDHDFKHHKKSLLGGDDHDFKLHRKSILGGDDHDFKPHRKSILGGDDHDLKPHRKSNLGGDDHDFKPHRKSLLGGDDHDFKPHRKAILGGDDHDYKPHKKAILGGNDHDFKPHRKTILGGDDHDFKPHRKSVLGGDNHDYKLHKKTLLGQGDHDYKRHQKTILGGGDHDKRKHRKSKLTDDHNIKSYKKPVGDSASTRQFLDMFEAFSAQFNRSYPTRKEYIKRFHIFRSNLRKIELMRQNEMGTAQYGITKFADYTGYEFRKMLGLKPHMKPSVSVLETASIPDVKAPVEFDWRKKGVVTPVKNQGMCGSCWAFSVTGNVEGQWAIKHKKLYSLSEQELVDCDETDQGCEGGLPENAYKAIKDLGGLETENGYPYEGEDDKCQLDTKKIKVNVNGSVEIPEDEEAMKAWLYKNGPISIGINANALQFYVGGVSHPFRFLCNPDSLDHGMLIVGYGVHTTKYLHRRQPFWLVKNSWGEDWGEKGYYRVFRGDGTCGVNKMATSATVA